MRRLIVYSVTEIWWSHSARNLPAARGRDYNIQDSFCLFIADYSIKLIENVSRTTFRLVVKHSSELSRRVPILHDKASKRLVRKKKELMVKREAEWCSIFHNLLKCLRSVASWICGLAVCVLRKFTCKFTLTFSPRKKNKTGWSVFFREISTNSFLLEVFIRFIPALFFLEMMNIFCPQKILELEFFSGRVHFLQKSRCRW